MQEAPLVEVGDDVNASGALLVSCFPSVGFVSSIVAHFMVEKLDLELVGGRQAPKPPPHVLGPRWQAPTSTEILCWRADMQHGEMRQGGAYRIGDTDPI